MSVYTDRINAVLYVLAQACCENFEPRLEIAEDVPDEFQSVEIGVNTLLQDLASAKQRNAAHLEQISRQGQMLQQRQGELLSLSAPISLIWPQVLLMPIIGNLDSERATIITETLLLRIVQERATHAILDATGVGKMDAATAQAVLRLSSAIGLLGATCLLTGLSAEMARVVVQLNQDFSRLRTLPRMFDALEVVFAERGIRLESRPRPTRSK